MKLSDHFDKLILVAVFVIAAAIAVYFGPKSDKILDFALGSGSGSLGALYILINKPASQGAGANTNTNPTKES